jgi:hypothetical protein
MTAANHFSRILHPLIVTIASEQAWFEINPAHAEAGESVDANLGNLERAGQWFLDTILMGLADSPPALRQLLSTVASCFRQQGLKAMCQAASLCFFCQLILPLITRPDASLLPPDVGLSPRSSRAFVYIAESLRAVVSNAPFDTNSSAGNGFMSVMNSFVVRNAPKTLVAFEHVITLPASQSGRSSAIMSDEGCAVDEADDLRLISNLVADRRDFFESWLLAQGLSEDLALLKATEFAPSDKGYASTMHRHYEHSIQKSKNSRESSSPSGSESLDNHSDGSSDEIPVSLALTCDDESQSTNASSTALSLGTSVSNAVHTVAAARTSTLAISTADTDALQIAGGDAAASRLATQSISVEESSLSPVSFLVQSHIGVVPPSSPLSRTSQAAHGRVFQPSDKVASGNALVAKALAADSCSYSNPAVKSESSLGESSGDEVKLRNEAEELELLLQHQLLSERTAQHGHRQQPHSFQPHSVQLVQDENPAVSASAHHGHNHQITQHHVLRIPDSSRHSLPEFSETAVFADVIKPLATRPSHPPSLSAKSTVEALKPSNTNASMQQVARLQPQSSCSAHEGLPLAGVGVTLKRNSQGALCVRRVRTDGPSQGTTIQKPEYVCLLS